MQVVILCGGKATRLNSLIGKTPKMLAKFDDKLFFDYICDFLFIFPTIHKITLLTGVGSEEIEKYISKKYFEPKMQIEIYKDNLFGQGTSRALHQALDGGVLDKEFLLMYGDSLPDLDLSEFIKQAVASKANIFFSYIDKKFVEEECRIQETAGRVYYYSDITAVKSASDFNFFIDYGVYYVSMNEDLRNLISIESDLKEVLGKFSNNSVCFGYEASKPFIEMGNPISFASASDKLRMRFSK
jgi:NDP-sugar pyrophosphorylase family protein